MILPTEFTMANRHWTVELLTKGEMKKRVRMWQRHHLAPDEVHTDELHMGLCSSLHATILINKDVHDGQVEAMGHTLCHEIIHAMLFSDGIDDHDEAFVDRMGGYLYQLLETQDGELLK